MDNFFSLSRDFFGTFFLFKASSESFHNLKPLMLLYFKQSNSVNAHKFSLFGSSFGPKDSRLLLSIKAVSINLCTFSGTCSAHLVEIVADDP